VNNKIQNNLRSLGPKEAKVVLSFREQGLNVVTTAEVLSLLGNGPSAHRVIENLVRKGWLSRLKRGRYMTLPPEYGPENLGENNPLALASAILDPSYIGWWAAASYHGFTTQKPRTISVAALRQFPSRVIEGHEIRFVKIVPRKFFGFRTERLYGRDVCISTPAKTLVDCVDRPDLAGGAAEIARIVHGASSSVDPYEVADAALMVKSTATLQRLGFLSDLVGWEWPLEIFQKIRGAIPASRRITLGRPRFREGDLGYVNRWGIFVHATPADLLADVTKMRKNSF
jgi:predicted transcriptional regulator of viral defense system